MIRYLYFFQKTPTVCSRKICCGNSNFSDPFSYPPDPLPRTPPRKEISLGNCMSSFAQFILVLMCLLIVSPSPSKVTKFEWQIILSPCPRKFFISWGICLYLPPGYFPGQLPVQALATLLLPGSAWEVLTCAQTSEWTSALPHLADNCQWHRQGPALETLFKKLLFLLWNYLFSSSVHPIGNVTCLISQNLKAHNFF